MDEEDPSRFPLFVAGIVAVPVFITAKQEYVDIQIFMPYSLRIYSLLQSGFTNVCSLWLLCKAPNFPFTEH